MDACADVGSMTSLKKSIPAPTTSPSKDIPDLGTLPPLYHRYIKQMLTRNRVSYTSTFPGFKLKVTNIHFDILQQELLVHNLPISPVSTLS
jgi:hypothetical protein